MGPRALALALLLVGACGGPRARVSNVRVEASPLPGRVRVEARIENLGRGRGQIEAQIRLRDRRTGRAIAAERNLELRPHGAVALVADLEAPPGDYSAEVEAEYPPK